MLGKYNRRTVSTTTGKVVGNATVQFFWQLSGAAVTVYSDPDGNNALGSSVQSDADGRIAVFLPPGRYRIVVTLGGNVVDEITYEPIVNDLATSAVDDFALRLVEMQDPAQTSYIRTLTSGFSEFRSVSQVRTDLSINNVDNTSDANKPISSATQTALNGKQETITGGASTIASSNLTIDRALLSNGSGKVAVSATTAAELGYLTGATSNIQTQLNGKLNLSGGTLTGVVNFNALANANTFFRWTGGGGWAAAVHRQDVGGLHLDWYNFNGTSEVQFRWRFYDGTAFRVFTTAAGGRLTYGGNDLLMSSDLAGAVSTIATSNLTANRALTSDGSGKVAASAVTATELSYLTGVTSNIQTQLNNLAGGSGTVSWGSVTGTLSNQTDLQNALNGKAASVHTHTKADVGLANVDNTSDLNKPISTATQTALNAKASATLGLRTSNASTTLALTDNNGIIFKSGTSSYTYTVPANSSVSLPVGYTVTLINDATSGNITVAQASGVAIVLAGPRTAGNKTIAPGGMGTLVKVGTDRWFISGAGVS